MENNNKVWIAIIVIVIVLGGVYFAMRSKNSAAPAMPAPASSQQAPASSSSVSAPTSNSAAPSSLKLNLTAQNNSGEGGTVTLSDENGKTKVVFDATGFPQGVSQPSHIHTGSCANPGAVKYSLTPLMNGKAETVLDVSLADLIKSLPLYANIHKSASEVNVFTACADITASGQSAAPATPTSQTPAPAAPATPTPAPKASTGGSSNFGY